MNTLEAITTRPSEAFAGFQDELVDHETIEQEIVSTTVCSFVEKSRVLIIMPENEALQKKIAEEYTLNFVYNTGTLEHAPLKYLVVLTAVKGRSGMERDGSATTDEGENWMLLNAGVAAQTFSCGIRRHGVHIIMGIFDAEKVAELLPAFSR